MSNKTIYQLLKRTAFFSGLTLILASCHKDDHRSNSTGVADLTVVHASPGMAAYDVALNGRRLNASPFAYGNYYNYGLVPAGNAEFKISLSGTSLVATKDVFSLKPSSAYSLYIADLPSKVSLLLTKDDLSFPAMGKAKLRFVNLNPDAGSLNLTILGDTTKLFAKVPFKSTTDFMQVEPSTGIGFALTDSTGSDILAASSKYRIDEGRIYTVVAKGAKSVTDTIAPAVGLIRNR
jgi:uncharacterized protein DUF4397